MTADQDEVEVWVDFDQRWVGGYEVAQRDDDGVRVRRRHDGAVLPEPLPPQAVRPSLPGMDQA